MKIDQIQFFMTLVLMQNHLTFPFTGCLFSADVQYMYSIINMVRIIKSPRVTGELVHFWFVSAAVSAAAAVLPTLFNFLGKPLKLISSKHTWLTYGCGKIFWHPSRWPWVKVTKLLKRDAIYVVPTIKWEPLIQSLQNRVGIPSWSCFPPDWILEQFCQMFCF